ncbi:hypothetical protein D3C78_1954190 [compost metagenome]
MRYVPEIVETKDSMRKGKLIQNHLGVLIEEIIKFNPEMKSIMERAIKRLNHFEAKIE